MRHIDAVIVRIADLRRTRHHHNLFWMQTVENLKDALFQRRASHYRVIDDHEVILVWCQRSITDVIHVSCQVVALRIVCDKGAQFDVFPYHLLYAYLSVKLTETVRHAIEGDFSRIGNIRKDRVIHIAIDSLEDNGRQLLT